MKTVLYIFGTLLIATSSGFLSKTPSDLVGNWVYCDGYTFKYLELKSDGTYKFIYDSCKGDLKLSGAYTIDSDTLKLQDSDENHKRFYVLLDNTTLNILNDKGELSSTEALIRTPKQNEASARNSCNRKRKKNWR